MNDFCLFACSDQFQLPAKGPEWINAMQGLCRQLGIRLTNYAYDLDWEVSDADGAEGRFDPGEIDPLKQILAEKPVYQLLLWSQNDETAPANFRCEMFDEARFQGNRHVYLQFPMSRVERMKRGERFAFASNLLSSLNQVGKLDYAMITIMGSSLPATYFREAFTEDLSDEEALNLATWISQSKTHKTKLRGLYWGNFLGPGHLAQLTDKSAFMKRLSGMIGNQQISQIRPDSLFFMLPSAEGISDPIAASVASLLKEQDLLMQPDDRAREILRRSITKGQGR